MFVIKKENTYYKSSLRNPKTNKILDICWTPNINLARKFNTKVEITDTFNGNEMPNDIIIRKIEVNIVELNDEN